MNKKKIKEAVRLFLEGIGENPKRPDLTGTPQRIADMCDEIFSGIRENAGKELEAAK